MTDDRQVCLSLQPAHALLRTARTPVQPLHVRVLSWCVALCVGVRAHWCSVKQQAAAASARTTHICGTGVLSLCVIVLLCMVFSGANARSGAVGIVGRRAGAIGTARECSGASAHSHIRYICTFMYPAASRIAVRVFVWMWIWMSNKILANFS